LHARQENILFIIVRIESDTDSPMPSMEPAFDLSCLGIPQFHVVVERGRNELGTIVVEIDVANRHFVPGIRSDQLSIAVDFPQFNLAIHGTQLSKLENVKA